MEYKEITDPIKSEKEKFNGVLKTFHDSLEQIKADPAKMKTAIEQVKTAYGDLLSKIDEGVLLMSQNFDLESEHNTRSDFEGTLLNFLSMVKSYYTNFGDVIKELGYAQGLGISKFTYRNIQKYFNTYSTKAVMQGTKVDFESLAIDLTGYDEKFEDSKKRKEEIELESNRRRTAVVQRRKWSIITGAICAAVVIVILLFKNSPYSGELSIVLKILFCIGAAGLSAALIGAFRWKLLEKAPVDLVGGMGFAIFLLVSDIKPWSDFVPADFEAIIILKDEKDNDIAGAQIKQINIRLRDGVNLTGKPLQSDDAYLFRPIPYVYRDSAIELILNSDKWVFQNGKRSMIYKLLNKGNSIKVIRDPLSLQVWGTVTFINNGKKTKPKPKVEVYFEEIPSIRCVLDSFNTYRLKVPKEADKGGMKVVFLKNGQFYGSENYELGHFQPYVIKY